MKTIQEIRKEIQGIESQLQESCTDRERITMYKKIEKLRACILYLETSPRVEFIQSERRDLSRVIESRGKIIDNFFSAESYQKMTKSALTKLRKEQERINDIPRLKVQLETLNYLLS